MLVALIGAIRVVSQNLSPVMRSVNVSKAELFILIAMVATTTICLLSVLGTIAPVWDCDTSFD